MSGVPAEAGGVLLEPLEVLYDVAASQAGYAAVALPLDLRALYGPMALPVRDGHTETPSLALANVRPVVLANFVTTLDGVVSLDAPGAGGGGEISGFNAHDRMVMGLLRALADAVVVGVGTQRADPQHLWTADHIYPPLAPAYAALRAALGKPPQPLTVVVTSGGDVDLSLPVFRSGAAPVLIVTTEQGARVIAGRGAIPDEVSVAAAAPAGRLSARAILAAITHHLARDHVGLRILLEGGPHLLGAFLDEGCLDELFLTLAPQLAGRDAQQRRLALVEGKLFAPEHPLWTTLLSARRAGSHLFLRYGLTDGEIARR